jgi:hypothetical protein
MLSFENKKALRFIITLGTGKFGSSDNDQIILEGFRATADINKAGGMMMGTLRAKIYGVSQADMNSVTTLQWKGGTLLKNTVEVYAIDGPVESLVFAGNIVNAWADYQSAPDVFLHIQAQAAYLNQLKPVPPRSFKGQVDVASVMAQIARDMGYTFENNGVNVQLTDIYLANTAMEQAKELANMAGIGLWVDDGILAITQTNITPRHTVIPVISAATGLVGYPTFDGLGVTFQTLFNPAVTFGGSVKLETDVQQAAGEWIVTSVAHRLECERVGGAWFSNARGNSIGLAVTSR